jgi:hypothetical protein
MTNAGASPILGVRLAAMIASETHDRELGLWPALATLLLAGLLSSFLSVMLLAPITSTLMGVHNGARLAFLYQTFAGALLTALALPYALRAVTEFEITTAAAFAVTLGGALVSMAAVMLFEAAMVSGTGVVDGGAMSILLLFVSVAVEYQLLKRFARPMRVTKPPLAVEAELAYASASPSLPADVDHAAARVRLVLAALSQAEAVDVPRRVQEGLDELQEAAAGLESEGELDAPRRLLVAGIRQLQGELVELAESAWRGDHRSAINRLHGVQTIENALARLGA